MSCVHSESGTKLGKFGSLVGPINEKHIRAHVDSGDDSKAEQQGIAGCRAGCVTSQKAGQRVLHIWWLTVCLSHLRTSISCTSRPSVVRVRLFFPY